MWKEEIEAKPVRSNINQVKEGVINLSPASWPKCVNPIACFPVIKGDDLPDSHKTDGHYDKHHNALGTLGAQHGGKVGYKP